MTTRAARAEGHYLRRLLNTTAIAGGIQVSASLIPFRDMGDERHRIIVSNEPLSAQTIDTNTPNRPPDEAQSASPASAPIPFAAGQTEQRATLNIQALSPRIVRVLLNMGDAPMQPRDLGMLVPDFVAQFQSNAKAEVQETESAVIAHLNGITVHLRRDPFAISIGSTEVAGAEVKTALDDRNVHGLLSTPPPGILGNTGNAETLTGAYWSWQLTPDEHLYGLGEHFTPLDHRGEQITLWNTDAWGTTSQSSYKYVPFLQSSRGYGIFFHTPTPITVQAGVPSVRAALACVHAPTLDLFIVFGTTPKEILSEYTRLTGRATMPPRWAFGIWLSRCRYQTRAEVEEVARRARAEDIPCDVLHIDPAWLEQPGLSCDFVASEQAFPDLAGMVRTLGEQGFKISLWELPYVTAQSRRYQEAAQAGYFLKDEHGEPICADFGVPPPDGHNRAVLDFTNPAARAWWQDLHRPWLRAGVAVFKTDFGEGVPMAARAWNGMTGLELHNLYPLLYTAAVHEVITQETGRPGMVWGRSGWAGIQRYPAQWGGDPKTDAWAMRASLQGGLSLALSAPGIWSHDIGGFYGPPPSPELYIRWAQFGMLSPLTRAHGTTPREPWEFGEQALAIFRRYAKLRTRLNPYLYTMAWETHTCGLPMLRPLVLEFPADPVTGHIDDSYLLGNALLVAPIFSDSPEPVARQLYLPEGEWIDFWTEQRHIGGHYITRVSPLDIIPLYVRSGSILPLGPERSFVGDNAPDELTLEVYTGAESNARVVWDAHGKASELQLKRNGESWQLSIQGEQEANWIVRWHTPAGIHEQRLGRLSATVVRL